MAHAGGVSGLRGIMSAVALAAAAGSLAGQAVAAYTPFPAEAGGMVTIAAGEHYAAGP